MCRLSSYVCYLYICQIHAYRTRTIVHFKRLGSRVFPDSLNQYVFFFFKNNVHTTKQMQYTLQRILSEFLSDVFLIFFKTFEMSMNIYNGEKSVAQPSFVMT